MANASIPRPPRPLALLLVAVVLVGASWAVLVPAWQVTDEDVHYSYVETIVTQGRLPGGPGGPAGEFSTEQRESMRVTNARPTAFDLEAKPSWDAFSEREWSARDLPRGDGGGANQATPNPPAYYLFQAIPYALFAQADLFTRLTAMRLASVAWLLVNTVGAWLLAGELFRRRRSLQLLCAATVGLWPMLVHLSAAVNLDAMVSALFTVALWAGVVLIRRGLSLPHAVLLGAVTGLAVVTKATSIALVPGALFAVAWAAWAGREHLRRSALVAGAAVACVVVPFAAVQVVLLAQQDGEAFVQVGNAVAEPSTDLRRMASYLWQFYLPQLESQARSRLLFPVISDVPLINIWIGNVWGTFGWTNIWFPLRLYDVLFIPLTALIALGGAVAGGRSLGRGHPQARQHLVIAVFFGLVVVSLLAGLHWLDYQFLVQGKIPFLSGRYLLPLAGLGALALAGAVSLFSRSVQVKLIGTWVGGLFAYQLGALVLLLGRHYA